MRNVSEGGQYRFPQHRLSEPLDRKVRMSAKLHLGYHEVTSELDTLCDSLIHNERKLSKARISAKINAFYNKLSRESQLDLLDQESLLTREVDPKPVENAQNKLVKRCTSRVVRWRSHMGHTTRD